jgi:hypothetical protein
MYQQSAHHMLDMSAHAMRRDIKSEQDNMYAVGSSISHMHQGYGTPDLSAGMSGGMSIMHTPLSNSHPAISRSTSSISPIATATTTSPDSHEDMNTQSGDSSSNSSSISSQKHMPPKKRAHSVPNEMKDDTYWDKRKKNNDSAKRSREARRMKEEQIAMRVVYLEQENLQLRTEVSLLKSEIEKLRCMLYNS